MFAPPVAEARTKAAAGLTRKPMQAGPTARPAQPAPLTRPPARWDFSRIPIVPPERAAQPRPAPLQAKLAIGAIDDPLEHEADRVATQVMRAPGSTAPVNRRPPTNEEQALRPGAAAAKAGEAPALVHEVLRTPGQPLDPATRAFFEPRFGHNFSDVRVHADAAAARSAASVDARAYTVGSRVAFASGQYAPQAAAGRSLLAHELVHVVQQRAAHAPTLRRDTPRPAASAAPAPAPLPTSLDQYPEAERKSLVVLTGAVAAAEIALIYAPVAPGAVKMTRFPSSSIQFAFDPNIAAAAKPNLIQVAALLTGGITPPLDLGQTMSLEIAPLGMVMRFTHIAHGKPVRDVMLIEQLGPVSSTAAATTKFAAKKYTFDASLTDPGERDSVRQAVEAVPDSALRDSLVFARGRGAKGPGGRSGEYDASAMTVRLWDSAFSTSATRSGLSTDLTATIAHELGHAADRKPLDAAYAANTAAPSPATDRKVMAARALSGLRAQGSGANLTEGEVLSDLKPAFRAAAIKDGIALDTANPPRLTSTGSTATLKGGPTDYANTNWVELFAESFALFVTDRTLLRSIRPNISAFMVKSFP